SSTELVDAIRSAAKGQRYVPPEIADALVGAPPGISGAAPHERLSERELQVLMLIAAGRQPGDVAAELNLSPSTVSTHLVHIRDKLGVRTTGELIVYAYHSGLLSERS